MFYLFFTGRKKLAVVKRHIQNLVSSLLNVVMHLQGPKIFFRNLKFRNDFAEPDPGSVCLMCISVLTKISAKHIFFQLEACHIGQILHMPAAIFQSVFQLWTSKVPLCSNYTGGLIFGETEVPGSERSAVDREFCIKLYGACCRMLCTVLKHHRRFATSVLVSFKLQIFVTFFLMLFTKAIYGYTWGTLKEREKRYRCMDVEKIFLYKY